MGSFLTFSTCFIVKPTINWTLTRCFTWAFLLGNLASERVYSRNCCSLKCKHIFRFYYKLFCVGGTGTAVRSILFMPHLFKVILWIKP